MLNLIKTIALNSTKEVDNIVIALKKVSKISHVFYSRLFKDRTRLTLSNHHEWHQDFHEIYYELGALNRTYNSYNDCYLLWPIKGREKIHQIMVDEYYMSNIFSIVKSYSVYSESFTFVAKGDEVNLTNWYINNLTLLKKFINYFKVCSENLILAANVDRLILPKCLAVEPANYLEPQLPPNASFDPMTHALYLASTNGDIYLTPQESCCLQQLISGKTAKETARLLDISPRTVEGYLNNIRLKLKCRNKLEVMAKALRELI